MFQETSDCQQYFLSPIGSVSTKAAYTIASRLHNAAELDRLSILLKFVYLQAVNAKQVNWDGSKGAANTSSGAANVGNRGKHSNKLNLKLLSLEAQVCG